MEFAFSQPPLIVPGVHTSWDSHSKEVEISATDNWNQVETLLKFDQLESILEILNLIIKNKFQSILTLMYHIIPCVTSHEQPCIPMMENPG